MRASDYHVSINRHRTYDTYFYVPELDPGSWIHGIPNTEVLLLLTRVSKQQEYWRDHYKNNTAHTNKWKQKTTNLELMRTNTDKKIVITMADMMSL